MSSIASRRSRQPCLNSVCSECALESDLARHLTTQPTLNKRENISNGTAERFILSSAGDVAELKMLCVENQKFLRFENHRIKMECSRRSASLLSCLFSPPEMFRLVLFHLID